MMRALFRRVKGARKLFAASVLLGAAGGILLIAQAIYMARVVNGAFLGGLELAALLPALYVLLGIIALRALMHSAGDYAAAHMAQRIKGDLRLRLVRKLSELGPGYAKGERSGELIGTAYEGVEHLESYLAKYVPQAALSAFIPAAVFCVVAGLDTVSAIVFGVTLPLLVLFMILIGKAAKAKTDKQFKLLGRLGGHFHEILRGLPTLAMFNRSKAQIEIIDRIGEEHRRSAMGTLRLAFLSAFVMELFASLSTAIVAVFLGLRLVEGELGFETAFLVLLLAPEFYTPIRTLGAQFHAGQNGMSAIARIFDILQAEPTGLPEREDGIVLPLRQEGYRIEFEQVSVRRSGAEQDALTDVSFTLEPGERIALVGPTGAGKSTIVELLQGFLRPSSGRILIDGIDMTELSMKAWRRRLSSMPQRVHLFRGTVSDNIRLAAPEATEAEVAAAAEAAQAEGFIRQLPLGYETELGETAQLSGGQMQRIALARALLRQDAPLMLLDEPTSSLDSIHEAALLDALEPLLAARMSVTVAHRLHTVQGADRIIVLAEGRVVESGTPQQLLEAAGLYARLRHAAEAESAAFAAGTAAKAAADAMAAQAVAVAPAAGAAHTKATGATSAIAADSAAKIETEPPLAASLASRMGGSLPTAAEMAEQETALPELPRLPLPERPHIEAEADRRSAVQPTAEPQSTAEQSPAAGTKRAQSPQAIPHGSRGQTGSGSSLAVLRQLLGFVAPYKWRMLIAVLIGFATVASNAGLMGVSGYLIAKAALRPENILLLYVPIVGVRFFGIARGVFRYVERLVSHDLTFRILKQFRTWLYSKLEPQGARLLERQSSGGLLSSVISDVDQLQNLYLRVIAPPVVAMLAVILGYSIVAAQDPSLGWMLVGMMVLSGLVVPGLGHLLGRRGAHAHVETRAQLYGEVGDLLSGMEALSLYGRTERQEERIGALQQQLGQHQDRQHWITAATGGLMSGLANLTMWLMLVACIPLVVSGAMEGYMIPALMLAAFACFEALLPLPQTFQHFSQTVSSGSRLLKLAEDADQMTAQMASAPHADASQAVRHAAPAAADAAEPAKAAAAEPAEAAADGQQRPAGAQSRRHSVSASILAEGESPQPASALSAAEAEQSAVDMEADRSRAWRTELTGVSFRYAEQEHDALRNISLTLERGKQVAVVGESGAGKSTLLQLLLKLRDYPAGSITINGHELKEMSSESVRSQFAVVSQQVQLFNASVADNLRLGRTDATESELREAARLAMLDERIERLPQGYDTVIGEWGAKLSGGERQRLALARALVRNAPALLFDEPGSGLDALTERAFGDSIQQVLQERAVLWVTHKLSGLERMDEIIVLHGGTIRERGTHAELLRSKGMYWRMWTIQQQEAWSRYLA
ncbi:thiol reductant ABC exporter subunit CydD [Paenibacillus sp. SYP-B4298]|uniref:thiol reductant ABC exporter subunit CydD n=1 Tax=Paenibacillus sp. SYP-B4298 TaxID=2996034 RepID=UPI0022DD02B9|nr:thiol reductant ABC exporter subunit CydD [Paenibacillus sp. SYP-B4298]